MSRVAKVEQRDIGYACGRLEIHADAVGTTPESGVMKQEIEHLRKGQRRHDEINTFDAHNQQSHDECRDTGAQHRGRQGEPQVGSLIFWRDKAQSVGADAVERRVAERNKPGVSHQ